MIKYVIEEQMKDQLYYFLILIYMEQWEVLLQYILNSLKF